MQKNLKPVEQDVVDLAREGLAARIKRARNRRWRLEIAKRDLEEMEQLNDQAAQKLGDPTRAENDRQVLLARHRAELHQLAIDQGAV